MSAVPPGASAAGTFWSQRYDQYVVVSARRIKVVREETMASRDPRVDLDLTIEMDLSVTDPKEFVRLYGEHGDLTMPFYTTLTGDLRSRVRNRVVSEIRNLEEELQELSKRTSEEATRWGPVTIHAMNIHVRISQRALEVFQAMSIEDIAGVHGDAFLLALITQTTDESRKRAYVDYYNQRRKKEHENSVPAREARDDFATFIHRTFEDDPILRNKLLTDRALLDSMKTVFAQRRRALLGRDERGGAGEKDAVEFAASYPNVIVRGVPFLVDMWAFLPQDREMAIGLAQEIFGKDSSFRSGTSAMLSRGSTLRVELQVGHCSVEPQFQMMVWTGYVTNASFRVTPVSDAPNEAVHAVCRVFLHHIQIGEIHFALSLGVKLGERPAFEFSDENSRGLPPMRARIAAVSLRRFRVSTSSWTYLWTCAISKRATPIRPAFCVRLTHPTCCISFGRSMHDNRSGLIRSGATDWISVVLILLTPSLWSIRGRYRRPVS